MSYSITQAVFVTVFQSINRRLCFAACSLHSVVSLPFPFAFATVTMQSNYSSSHPPCHPASPGLLASPHTWQTAGRAAASACCRDGPNRQQAVDNSQQWADLALTCAVCCMSASKATRILEGVVCCNACLSTWQGQPSMLHTRAHSTMQPPHAQLPTQQHVTADALLQDDLSADHHHQQVQVSSVWLSGHRPCLRCNTVAAGVIDNLDCHCVHCQ